MGKIVEQNGITLIVRPDSVAEVLERIRELDERWGNGVDLRFLGWWRERYQGYVAYLDPCAHVGDIRGSWILAENRKHVIQPVPAESGAFCAVEVAPPDGRRPNAYILPADLEPGSPLGYGPTRALPGADIVQLREEGPAPYRAHSEAEPSAEVLRQVERTAAGAILHRPGHSLDVDRVWYWLARHLGLVAERDLEAYAFGRWRWRGRGDKEVTFDRPTRVWGFHHPPQYRTVKVLYVVHDREFMPPPKCGPDWCVEYVRKGCRPMLGEPKPLVATVRP